MAVYVYNPIDLPSGATFRPVGANLQNIPTLQTISSLQPIPFVPNLELQISQILIKHKYCHPKKTKKDALKALRMYKNLRHNEEKHVHNDGKVDELFGITGSIPVPYKGIMYNIPIQILLYTGHPYYQPYVFVRPTPSMNLEPSKHVDLCGRVNCHYLKTWNYPGNSLCGLIQKMISLFKQNPPVFTKPEHTLPQAIQNQIQPRRIEPGKVNSMVQYDDYVDIPPDYKDKNLNAWSVDDVCNWLYDIHLGSLYADLFRTNAIDGVVLTRLTDEMLSTGLGIAAFGHRNKILRKIRFVQKIESDKVPDEFMCPITKELMKDPVIVADGFTYERASIADWLASGKTTSPMTNLPLPHMNLIPNRSLKSAIMRCNND